MSVRSPSFRSPLLSFQLRDSLYDTHTVQLCETKKREYFGHVAATTTNGTSRAIHTCAAWPLVVVAQQPATHHCFPTSINLHRMHSGLASSCAFSIAVLTGPRLVRAVDAMLGPHGCLRIEVTSVSGLFAGLIRSVRPADFGPFEFCRLPPAPRRTHIIMRMTLPARFGARDWAHLPHIP